MPASPTDGLNRTFCRLTNEEVADLETAISIARRGYWRKELEWDDLFRFRRVLLVSESGSGKTYECRQQQKRLWQKGEAAFSSTFLRSQAMRLTTCSCPTN
ncbi:MAG: hypothetical protein ACOH2M_05360 [Cypionkella sp.]